MEKQIITNDDVKIKRELINEIIKQDAMAVELGGKAYWDIESYKQMSIKQLKWLLEVNGNYILNLAKNK